MTPKILMNKLKESSWIVSFSVTIMTILFSWFFTVGFTLQTPRDYILENIVAHTDITTRLGKLEIAEHNSAQILDMHTRRVCVLDTVEDLAKIGWLEVCRELGVNRGYYDNPSIYP